MILKLQTTPLN